MNYQLYKLINDYTYYIREKCLLNTPINIFELLDKLNISYVKNNKLDTYAQLINNCIYYYNKDYYTKFFICCELAKKLLQTNNNFIINEFAVSLLVPTEELSQYLDKYDFDYKYIASIFDVSPRVIRIRSEVLIKNNLLL